MSVIFSVVKTGDRKRAKRNLLKNASYLYVDVFNTNKKHNDKNIKNKKLLEGCIVLNEHNTVFARSGPLYATGVSLGHQSRQRQRHFDHFSRFCRAH